MFDGVPQEQFHQFISSSRTLSSSLPIINNPISFPHHPSSPNTFPTSNTAFDDYPSHHLLHQLHQQPAVVLDEEDKDQKTSNSALLSEQIADPWSNDEVLSLLRIRSSMENWFPDLTWEHVSRKLAEFGFKRSAEKCKEKFEEEIRSLNSINCNKNRFFSELEQLYHGEETQEGNEELEQQQDKIGMQSHVELGEEDAGINVTAVANNNPSAVLEINEEVKKTESTKANNKKRKRENKFKMFKGFFVDIVNKMMAQQEEMNSKLLEDMINRDEEKIAREEAWKKQEMDSFNKEIEIRVHEQAIAGDRQATIIGFLQKFTSNFSQQKEFGISSLSYDQNLVKVSNALSLTNSPSLLLPQNNSSSPETLSTSNPSTSTSALPPASQNHNMSDTTEIKPSSFPPSPAQQIQKKVNYSSATKEIGDDIGKRWPKDEVLALINMRCSLYNSNDQQDKEGGGGKGSLWERISQGMLELGYKRSAKRCKEKWENINKYFRKTKHVNKKRSIDSRTCPYFHQLSSLYNQGTLPASDGQEKEIH